MPNPIQPQPIEPVRGPFSQFLEAPKMAQLQQFEQAGPQPSGREGVGGQMAMYLTRFMQGASVAKAREQAQSALQEARDADSINRLYSAMGQSDKDPEDLQRLQAQINDMAGRHVMQTMKEGGKKNPILKGLHMIGEQILGGQDKDQYVPVDQNAVHAMWSNFAQLPSMGDKYNQASQQLTSHLADIKTQMAKELGRMPSTQEFQARLAQTPVDVNGKTMSILDAGNSINEKFKKPSPVDQFMSVLGPQPSPIEDLKRNMFKDLFGSITGGGDQAQALPTKESVDPSKFDTQLGPQEEQQFQQWKAKNAPNDSGQDYDLRGAFKAGVTPDANGHMPDTFKKPNHPTFSNQSQYLKGHEHLAGTWDEKGNFIPPSAGPPAAKGGLPDRINPASISLLAGDKEFGHLFQQDKEFYFNPNHKGDRDGVWKDVWKVAGTAYDASTGQKLDQDRIEPKVLSVARASGAGSEAFNVTLKDGSIKLVDRNKLTGKYTDADGTPIEAGQIVKRDYAGSENVAANNQFKAIQLRNDISKNHGIQMTRADGDYARELAQLERDKSGTKMNPQTGALEPTMSEQRYQEQKARLKQNYDARVNNINNLTKAHIGTANAMLNGLTVKKEDVDSIENHTSQLQGKADLDGMNNPLGLKNQNGFLTYDSPEKGLEAGKNLLRSYMSPTGAKAVSQSLINRGVKAVNADSTLGDLMEQWAPYGDGPNDPQAYAQQIAKALKLPNGINTRIGNLTNRVDEIIRVMAQTEGGSQWKSLAGQPPPAQAAAAPGGSTPPPPAAATPANTGAISLDDLLK